MRVMCRARTRNVASFTLRGLDRSLQGRDVVEAPEFDLDVVWCRDRAGSTAMMIVDASGIQEAVP